MNAMTETLDLEMDVTLNALWRRAGLAREVPAPRLPTASTSFLPAVC